MNKDLAKQPQQTQAIAKQPQKRSEVRKADKKLNFTQWGIKYPWHISMKPYPVNEKGYCQCQCYYCLVHGQHQHPEKIERNGFPEIGKDIEKSPTTREWDNTIRALEGLESLAKRTKVLEAEKIEHLKAIKYFMKEV